MYNILSLDGGGMRGLILLKQLVKLEELLRVPINEHFQMISGVSTGSIIASLLSIGYSANDLLDFYNVHGSKIFKKKFLRFGIFRPKYKDDYLNYIIKEYSGNNKLSNVNNDLIVIGYNANTREKKIFKSRNAKTDENYDYDLFEVIRSSISAPTFFTPWLLSKDKQYYIDGGLVINNPSMISWIESMKYVENEKINILSFSTGRTNKKLKKSTLFGGMLTWAKPTVDILLSEQSKTTDYHMENIFKNNEGLYMRCESIIEHSNGKIDDASKKNIENMLKDGDQSSEINENKMKYFIENTK